MTDKARKKKISLQCPLYFTTFGLVSEKKMRHNLLSVKAPLITNNLQTLGFTCQKFMTLVT